MKLKTFTLTIFLIKPYTSIKECLKSKLAADEYLVKLSDGGTATLFVQSTPGRQPRWVSFLSGSVGDLPALLTNSASAALFLHRAGRTVALTFGYGRNFLRPGSWEEDFGLKVTLNSVDAEKIRSVDRVTLDAIGQHSRIQASREAAISEFGLDLEQDLLRAVTGKPADPALGKNMSGKDALRVTLPITLTKLPELLDSYLKRAEGHEYKKLFPWVDQIHELQDPDKIAQLDFAVLGRLKSGDFERLWLAIPEIIDWDHVDGFKYRRSGTAPLHSDVHVAEMLSGTDLSGLSVEMLKHRKISAISCETGEPLQEWTWYRCLYAEVDEGADTFLLTAGKWYKVGSSFRDRVNKAYAEIPAATVTLPDCAEKSERLYNERVAAETSTAYALYVGNPVKGERDSGLKLNAIPL